MLVHFTPCNFAERRRGTPSLHINREGIADRARRRGPCTSVVW